MVSIRCPVVRDGYDFREIIPTLNCSVRNSDLISDVRVGSADPIFFSSMMVLCNLTQVGPVPIERQSGVKDIIIDSRERVATSVVAGDEHKIPLICHKVRCVGADTSCIIKSLISVRNLDIYLNLFRCGKGEHR